MKYPVMPDWLGRRLDPEARYGLRVTLLAVAVVLVMVPFSFLLIQVTSEGALVGIDTEVSDEVHEEVIESPALETISTVVSFLGSPGFLYVLTAIAAYYFWRRGSRRIAVYLLVTNLLGGAINSAVKLLVSRPRPDPTEPVGEAFGYSFPSGHTVAATVGFGSLLLAFMPLIPRRWRVPAIVAYFVAVAAVAGSRLGLVVHYLSDVTAGFVLGLAWLAVSTAAFSIWRVELGRPSVEVTEGVEPETIAGDRD